ncbi:MAG TPA: cytochrome P460 family protein [Fimbriimonadaceae bacterium]|nr:cytochrome P460 family protein [Fimbriimonadaceae bacterium]
MARSALLFGLALASLASGVFAGQGTKPDRVVSLKGFRKWRKATASPHTISASAYVLCVPASPPAGPHTAGTIEVRVNPTGFRAFLKETGLVPVGTIVVKEKRRSQTTPIELLTVMEKVGDKGTVDDWRFYAFSGDGRKELKTDAATCRNCHKAANVDHLFRTYLLQRAG